jgi:hypothetical protein
VTQPATPPPAFGPVEPAPDVVAQPAAPVPGPKRDNPDPPLEMIDQAGNSVNVPLSKAQEAYQQGGLGFVPGMSLPVKLGDGRLGTVDTKDLEQVFNDGGQIVHPDEVNADRLRRWADSPQGHEVAASQGFIRGLLPFGIGDELSLWARRHAEIPGGFSAEQQLKVAEEEHPILSGAGQAVGMVGGALVGGSPFEAVGARAAGLAEGLVGSEPAANLFGRAVQSSVKLGARTAAEGALIGADDAIHESQLGDPDLTAEKLWAYAGRGMLFGGITGAALGPLGHVAGAAGRGIAKRVLGGGTVGEAAEEQYWRALNPNVADAREADRIPGGAKGIGRMLGDEDLVRAGDNVENIAPRVSAKRNQVGETIDRHLADLDALRGTEEGVSLEKVVARIKREVLDPIESKPFYESIAGQVNRAIESLQRAAGYSEEALAGAAAPGESPILSFKTWADWRRGLDDLIYRTSGEPTPIIKEMRAMRGIIEDEIETAGERIAKNAGTQWAEEYKATKLLYRRLIVADEAAQDAVRHGMGTRFFSPTDYLASLGGLHFATGPFGIMKGLAIGAIHHAVRTRGNATVAAMLGKLSSLGAVQRLTSGVEDYVESRIARTVTRKAAHEAEEEETVRTAENARAKLKAKYEENVRALDEVTAHPELLKERTGRLLGPVQADAPKTVAAYTLASQRAVKYLQSKRPAPTMDMTGLPPYRTPEVSDTKMASFNRSVEGATEPLKVLHEMQTTGLSPEHADAFRTVMPNLHREMTEHAVSHLSELKEPPHYQSRITLGRLTGTPGDPYLTAQAIRTSQEVYQQKQKPEPKLPRQQLKLSANMQTQTERAMGK